MISTWPQTSFLDVSSLNLGSAKTNVGEKWKILMETILMYFCTGKQSYITSLLHPLPAGDRAWPCDLAWPDLAPSWPLFWRLWRPYLCCGEYMLHLTVPAHVHCYFFSLVFMFFLFSLDLKSWCELFIFTFGSISFKRISLMSFKYIYIIVICMYVTQWLFSISVSGKLLSFIFSAIFTFIVKVSLLSSSSILIYTVDMKDKEKFRYIFLWIYFSETRFVSSDEPVLWEISLMQDYISR